MPTTDQKADLLFKKYLGKGSSGTSPLYFNEPKDGRPAVYPDQIWSDYYSVPVSSSAVFGIVEHVVDLSLIQIPGPSFVNAFYHDDLKDAIPFNFDPSGSYVPTLKKSDDTIIPMGQNDWFVDTEAGMLTFYGGLPTGVNSTNLPKITFWKYIGAKGGGGGGGGGQHVSSSVSSSHAETASLADTASYALTASYIYGAKFKDYMSGQIEYPTIDNVYFLIANNPSQLEIDSLTIALYSGNGSASLKVDNIPIDGMSDVSIPTLENTFYPTTPPILVQPGSRLILELNNMSVGAGRFYFTIGMNRTLM